MTMEYKSNYEKVTEDWKKRFLDMDQERLIERFQLNHDGQWLYLRYLGQQLKLSRTSGKVLFADREEINIQISDTFEYFDVPEKVKISQIIEN